MTQYACFTIVDWCANCLAKNWKDPSNVLEDDAVDRCFKKFLRPPNHFYDSKCLVVTQCILLTALAQTVAVKYGRDPSSILKYAVDRRFQQFLEAEPFERLTMPSYNIIYSLDNWRLANKLLNSNIEKILQAYSRMQLTGYSSNLWAL